MITDLERRLAAAHFDSAPGADTLARRAVGEGVLDVAFSTCDSPIGELLVAITPQGLVKLALPNEDRDRVLETLAARVSPRVLEAPALLDDVRRSLDEYFAGRRRVFDHPVDLRLVGAFGRRVLDACAIVPFGEVTTYGALADVVGVPRAARAVGNALGRNPVPIVVPCHRVLRAGGALGGYGGGLSVKSHLLRLEGVLVGG